MKKILIGIIVIVLIGVVVRLTFVRKKVATRVGKSPIAVEVMPVTRNSVKRTCTLIGALTADKTVQVFPETMGRVTKIFIKEGSYVSRGDRIIGLKNEAVGFEFEEAYITAPISGTVAKILADIGSTVGPQMPVALIVDISRIKVSFNAPEADAQCFKINGKVSVHLDAIPGKDFNGYITEISPVVDPLTKTVGIKAVVESPGSGLKPGMTARVTVNLGERRNIIAIPQDALVENSVFIVKNDSTAELRPIKIGLVGDELVEVIEGLNENDLVIVLGQQRLAGGEKVIPIVRER